MLAQYSHETCSRYLYPAHAIWTYHCYVDHFLHDPVARESEGHYDVQNPARAILYSHAGKVYTTTLPLSKFSKRCLGIATISVEYGY